MFLFKKSIFIFVFFCFFEGIAQPKILVFSKTVGFRHKSIEIGIQSLQKLGIENGFFIEATEDSDYLLKKIKHFDAVVFLNTSGDVFNEKQEKKFRKYIEKGGGLVGIHSATTTEYDWEWFGKAIGAYFVNHPKPQKALLKIENSNHRATSFLPKEWEVFDEWYNFKNINSDLEILMSLDENSYWGETHADHHPISWVQQLKKGKMFYTGLGHTEEMYQNPLFLKHILGGIHYVLQANSKIIDK